MIQFQESATSHDRVEDGSAITVRGLRKSYRVGDGSVEILHGVSLTIGFGEMVAIMGASGSGKSTLLYCLAGLEPPSDGEVRLLGRDVARTSRTELAVMRRTEVGFVFQAYNLIPTLTAFENVSLPYLLRRERVPADLIRSTLGTVGLAGRQDARPPSMSGGEQQRVALARVLAQGPRLIFADEPTGALDTTTGDLVLDELVRIAHVPGRCVLMVTHDPKIAARSDRVLFMRDGLLVDELVGAPVERVAAVLSGLSLGE